MQHLMAMNKGWKETLSDDKWDMCFLWHTTKEEEIFDILTKKSGRLINRYPPAIKELARKDNF